jgi:hypothetical protein
MQPLRARPDYGENDGNNKPQNFTDEQLQQLADVTPQTSIWESEKVLMKAARELVAIARDLAGARRV